MRFISRKLRRLARFLSNPCGGDHGLADECARCDKMRCDNRFGL